MYTAAVCNASLYVRANERLNELMKTLPNVASTINKKDLIGNICDHAKRLVSADHARLRVIN